MSDRRSLDQIAIPVPCDADWNSMSGNDEVRFCEHCNLHVTDLSSMTRQNAMRLVARSQGRLCVRFVQLPGGGVLARAPEKFYRIGRRVSRIAAGAFSATLTLSSATAQTRSKPGSEAERQTSVASVTLPQEPGATLSGVITDPNGAVVPGATVALTNAGSRVAFSFTTGDDGAYQFSLLEAGLYNLVVEAPSFARTEVPDLNLQVNTDKALNLQLEIPLLVAQLEVIANTTVVESVAMGVVAFVEPEDPLVKAAYKNDLDAVKTLVLITPDVNANDKQTNENALAYATGHGNREMVQTLLLAGADVNARSSSGQTAVMHLSEQVSVGLLRDLLSAGADLNARDEDGETPLIKAVTSGSLAVIKELIANGARMDARSTDGTTVLMNAAVNEDSQIAAMLIRAGVDVNAKNAGKETALLVAARSGQPSTLKILIDARAEIDARDSDGKTALMFAASNEDPRLARLLINAGADANAKDANGKTVLMVAAADERVGIVKELIAAGAELNATDEDGQTALMHANEFETVLLLVKAGADLTVRDNEGQTALSLARKYNQTEVVKLLESRGAPK